jgi:alpha-L-fucosidase 2
MKGETTFTREYISSHADDVLAVHVAADKKGSVSFEVSLSRPERATLSVQENTLIMEGQLNDGYGTDKGVRYLTKVQIVNKGGELTAGSNTLAIANADEAVILISTSTDMLDK